MPEMIDLYHFTSAQAAEQIQATGKWVSRENTGYVYASDRLDGQARGYGPVVVHVRVPVRLAMLEDEFPDGETHYVFDPVDAVFVRVIPSTTT